MENQTIIAIYGAVTATVALAWNIYNSLSLYRGKLKIDKERHLKFPEFGIELTPILICKVTNIGRTSRHIEMPRLEFVNVKKISKDHLDKLFMLQIQPTEIYPKELKPGETHNLEFNLEIYYDKALKDFASDYKLYFYVKDTHGKKYSSEYFDVGELKADVSGARSFVRARLTSHSS